MVAIIMNTPIPTPEQQTVGRLRTLGLILPRTRPLIRTDLPPKLILIGYPNGLLGSEPVEREHAWWENSTPLDELIRAENRRRERMPIVMCRPEDEPRIRRLLAEGGFEDRVKLVSSSLIPEHVPPGEVLFYDPRPFLDQMDEELVIFEPTPPRRWVPPLLSPRDIVCVTGVC
jgi:hypothetical protein